MTFNNMWSCTPNKPLKTPVIDGFIRDYITLRPLAKDEKGKILNETRFDIQKEESKTKLSDYVESFRDECDVYKILERCARSGDYSILLNDKPYGDTTPFSSDRPVNDENLSKLQNGYESIDAELKESILKGLSDEEILNLIKEKNTAAAAKESEDNNNA